MTFRPFWDRDAEQFATSSICEIIGRAGMGKAVRRRFPAIPTHRHGLLRPSFGPVTAVLPVEENKPGAEMASAPRLRGRLDPIEAEFRVDRLLAIEQVEGLGVGVGPASLDGEAGGPIDRLRHLVEVGPGDD